MFGDSLKRRQFNGYRFCPMALTSRRARAAFTFSHSNLTVRCPSGMHGILRFLTSASTMRVEGRFSRAVSSSFVRNSLRSTDCSMAFKSTPGTALFCLFVLMLWCQPLDNYNEPQSLSERAGKSITSAAVKVVRQRNASESDDVAIPSACGQDPRPQTRRNALRRDCLSGHVVARDGL